MLSNKVFNRIFSKRLFVIKSISITTLFAGTLLASAITLAANEEVNLYSARKEALIKPIIDNFTQQTGIKVNLITGKADALLKRIESEGKK